MGTDGIVSEAHRNPSQGPIVDAHPPIACTMELDAMADRIVAWHQTLERAGVRTTTADGAFQIEFGDALPLTELARLVGAERCCCAFFSFTIISDHRGLVLEVRAPAEAGDAVSTLFGFGGSLQQDAEVVRATRGDQATETTRPPAP
jgi:hypothetical protein